MAEPPKTERQRYLDDEVTHDDYYAGIARDLHLRIGADLMARVRKSKDKHFNDIRLSVWDNIGLCYLDDHAARAAFKARGDLWSRAGMVCALKRQAKLQLEEGP